MINKFVAAFVAFCVLVLCAATSFRLACFLSFHVAFDTNSEQTSKNANIGESGEFWRSIFINAALLALFIAHHTLQAKVAVKNFLAKKGYDVVERLLYNILACITLQLVMSYWIPLENWTIWEMSPSSRKYFYWPYMSVHCIAWLVVYSGCLTMDIGELIGIRQVYYFFQGWPDPLCQKSESLCRFYSHMRHPSFTALVVILFFQAVMTLDRLILAYLLTIYMVLGFKIDTVDYNYHRRMLLLKEQGLTSTCG